MQIVALGWELYERTHQAAALGYVGLVEFLPVLFLSLPAGHAVDRFDRKSIVTRALLLSAIASTILAVISVKQGPIPLIYVCIAFIGVAQAFTAPARWSLLPSVVPDELLPSAITWSSSSWQIAAVVGPALGGLVLWASGEAAFVYLLAALSAVASAALIIRIRPRPLERVAEEITLKSLFAGLRFVFNTDLLLAAITLDLFAVLLGGATALLPIFAKDILDVGPAWLGWLRAAPSLGALLMAVVLAHRPPLRHAGPSLLWAVAGFGAATVVFGFSKNVWLSFAMLALTGALDQISIVVRGTLGQVLTPDSMRGRVGAVNAIFIGSSNELGDFESGMTAQWFGPVASVVGGGIGSIVVVLAVMARWPGIMRLGSLSKLLVSVEVPAAAAEQANGTPAAVIRADVIAQQPPAPSDSLDQSAAPGRGD